MGTPLLQVSTRKGLSAPPCGRRRELEKYTCVRWIQHSRQADVTRRAAEAGTTVSDRGCTIAVERKGRCGWGRSLRVVDLQKDPQEDVNLHSDCAALSE